MIFGRLLAKTDHSAWLHIVYGVSKLSQTQVSCVWKSATNIRALKVELPTRYNVHRKDTYIPSLYDFGLAQTLSCTNQTWGEYLARFCLLVGCTEWCIPMTKWWWTRSPWGQPSQVRYRSRFFVQGAHELQCNLDLGTLLVSPETVDKLHNVTKSNDFM